MSTLNAELPPSLFSSPRSFGEAGAKRLYLKTLCGLCALCVLRNPPAGGDRKRVNYALAVDQPHLVH
jgi:hypothetical protein